MPLYYLLDKVHRMTNSVNQFSRIQVTAIFREVLNASDAPVYSMRFAHFTQETLSLMLPFVYQVDLYSVN